MPFDGFFSEDNKPEVIASDVTGVRIFREK